jgi:hypothetical protein
MIAFMFQFLYSTSFFFQWRHSLKTVDLSWIQNIELGIESLTDGPPIPLERIQLTGSNIISKDLQ